MRTILSGILLATGFALPAAADHGGHASGHPDMSPRTGDVVVVQCYRGPWKETIWDRPTPVFVDTLVSVGYDYPAAHAIAERVCKDVRLVGNPEALRAEVERIIAESPQYWSR
ncbi:hypothetical protein ruthe_00548 [Rubellimicrobium thermophilum DSM 16684]|uniref:Uncharacterized protein n=2 Tax=Rubellimicrobium TaxID=295418 RepID=S9R658_9RHOB|nr:hypothetical protein ruthe_00548 [Rubellimicrobium thermophilum DSM 16684]